MDGTAQLASLSPTYKATAASVIAIAERTNPALSIVHPPLRRGLSFWRLLQMTGASNTSAWSLPDWIKGAIPGFIGVCVGGLVSAGMIYNQIGNRLDQNEKNIERITEAFDRRISDIATLFGQQTANLSNDFASKLKDAASLETERANALSVRITNADNNIRDNSIISARQQEKLEALKTMVEDRSKQRDAQLMRIEEQIDRISAMLQNIPPGITTSPRNR